jgi:hypothetical protein
MTIDLDFGKTIRTDQGVYMGVAAEEDKTLADGRKFRLVLYGAFNAMGLIGTERNGILVLDLDRRQVVCDEIANIPSGWYGPSKDQLAVFQLLVDAEDGAFRNVINSRRDCRYNI